MKEGTEWGGEAGKGGDGKGECCAATAGNFVSEFSACVSESHCGAESQGGESPGRRVPGEGQVWASEAAPQLPSPATPSPPASVALSSLILPGLLVPVCSYLSPPPLSTHLAIPRRPPPTSGHPIPRHSALASRAGRPAPQIFFLGSSRRDGGH